MVYLKLGKNIDDWDFKPEYKQINDKSLMIVQSYSFKNL